MGLICSEEKEKRNIIQEKKLLDYPHPITDKVKQVMNIQMKNCVCKIITNSSCGTGFFGLLYFLFSFDSLILDFYRFLKK